MAKARSPRYPAIGLGEAIEKIEMVYKKDVQNKIPREVVAKHAGYTGLNGKSLGMLSALLKYGLLDGRAEETYVSDLALEIIANPVESLERAAAIGKAAFRPALFVELCKQFPGGKGSDEAIRAYLLKKKFLPNSVNNAIRSYRETMELVSSEGVDYDESMVEESHVIQSESAQLGLKTTAPHVTVSTGKPPRNEISSPELGEILRYRLTDVCSTQVYFDGPVNQVAIEKLIKLLELNKDAFPEQWVVTPGGEGEEEEEEEEEGG